MRVQERTIAKHLITMHHTIFSMWDGNVNHGVVAAWIYIPGYRKWIKGRSWRNIKTGMWTHGERDAINKALKFLREQGDKTRFLPEGCEMITTLEPCSLDMAMRTGCSCSDLIAQHNIKTVYCGVLDPKHIGNDGTPHSHPFNLILTKDDAAIQCSLHLRSFIPGLDE